MGLFKCCIKQQVILKDDFRRISQEDDAPAPPDKEAKPCVELTADVRGLYNLLHRTSCDEITHQCSSLSELIQFYVHDALVVAR